MAGCAMYDTRGKLHNCCLYKTCMREAVCCFQFNVLHWISPHTVPSITTDGRYLYILYPLSGNLVKLGTGEGGTLRGFCYTQSTTQFEPGFIAWANGVLFYRKHSVDVVADNKQSSGQQQQSKLLPFCHRINHDTLQVSTLMCFNMYLIVWQMDHTCTKLYVMVTKIVYCLASLIVYP